VVHAAGLVSDRDVVEASMASFATARQFETHPPEAISFAEANKSLSAVSLEDLEADDPGTACKEGLALPSRSSSSQHSQGDTHIPERSLFFFEPPEQKDGGEHYEGSVMLAYKDHYETLKRRHRNPGLYQRIGGRHHHQKPGDLPDTVRGAELLKVSALLVSVLRDYIPSKHTDEAGCGRAIDSIVKFDSDNELAGCFGATDLSWLRKCNDTRGIAAPGSIGTED